MKNKIWILIITLILLGCNGGDPLDDSGYFSDFVLENASNYTVELEFNTSFPVTTETNSIQVNAGNSEQFHTAFDLANDISFAPSPQNTFSIFNIYAVVGDQSIPVIEPISDERWVMEREGDLTIYTLVLLDSDFLF